jgi:molecular chaperone DnaK (HSP70)
VNVDDVAVQQMVDESVEHAFEDLAARRWIEASLKAKELISATQKALKDCAGELEPNYLAQVEKALQRVQALVKREEPSNEQADLKELQSACSSLDDETRPMAEVLMDRAMEALLRKRGMIQ